MCSAVPRCTNGESSMKRAQLSLTETPLQRIAMKSKHMNQGGLWSALLRQLLKMRNSQAGLDGVAFVVLRCRLFSPCTAPRGANGNPTPKYLSFSLLKWHLLGRRRWAWSKSPFRRFPLAHSTTTLSEGQTSARQPSVSLHLPSAISALCTARGAWQGGGVRSASGNLESTSFAHPIYAPSGIPLLARAASLAPALSEPHPRAHPYVFQLFSCWQVLFNSSSSHFRQRELPQRRQCPATPAACATPFAASAFLCTACSW